MEIEFKKNVSLEDRINQCKNLLKRNPGQIPVILIKEPNCKLVLEKNRFLVQKNFNVSQFITLVRANVKINKETALFFSTDNTTLLGEKLMGDIYEKYKDKEDGFLYIIYSCDLAFG